MLPSSIMAPSVFSALCPQFLFCFLVHPRPPSSTLFPYTTLFRSARLDHHRDADLLHDRHGAEARAAVRLADEDRKSTRLNSSHTVISYAVFCLKKKTAG